MVYTDVQILPCLVEVQLISYPLWKNQFVSIYMFISIFLIYKYVSSLNYNAYLVPSLISL